MHNLRVCGRKKWYGYNMLYFIFLPKGWFFGIVGHNLIKKGLLSAWTKSHVQAKSEYPPAKVGDGGQVEIRNKAISKDKSPKLPLSSLLRPAFA